ncbi:MAG: ribonuclease E inhibitor RraB [Polyangiaceae bacterium]
MANEQVYPDDENGEVLRGMAARGVDLVSPRVVDFEHCFEDQASALAFREAVLDSVFEVRLIEPEGLGTEWDVQCRVRLIPTHAAITETELRLAKLAQSFDGFPDGWGSASNPDGSPVE